MSESHPDALVIHEAQPSLASWEVSERGPRVILRLGGEDHSVSADRARKLRDDITRVLRELGLDR